MVNNGIYVSKRNHDSNNGLFNTKIYSKTIIYCRDELVFNWNSHGGIAHAFPILLSARMVQASGSAIMMPLLMNVMLVSFPVAKRGAAMGMFGLILMFAPAIGPTLSGWIVEHYNWRMLFYFVAPISIGILIVGIFLIKG